MKIFVTGASGFVGGAFVRAMRDKHILHAMSRSAKSDAAISALGAVPVRCELGKVSADLLAGMDAIVHCAAYVEEWGPWSAYWQANVIGTQQLLEAAKKAGVKRFVHVGTEAALFHGQDMVDVDETAPLSLRSPFPYSRSKAHAEKSVREAHDPSRGFTTIVVRPRFVWGPGDVTLVPVITEMAAQGQFAWIDGGQARTSTTYIGNLVHALECALTRGRSGEAYFVLDGPPVVFREFVTSMMKAAGVTLPDKNVPGFVVRGLARVSEPLWRFFRVKSKPPITRFTAAIMSRHCTLKDDKARRELGYQPPFTVEAGLTAMAKGG